MTPKNMLQKFFDGHSIESIVVESDWVGEYGRELFEMLLRGYALGLQAAKREEPDEI
ncbi:MAG: hypothetical protein KGL39_57295 [Patescibacteria group bacterium]|nr:hypothetical protein [Patescibacteria group bacterium]